MKTTESLVKKVNQGQTSPMDMNLVHLYIILDYFDQSGQMNTNHCHSDHMNTNQGKSGKIIINHGQPSQTNMNQSQPNQINTSQGWPGHINTNQGPPTQKNTNQGKIVENTMYDVKTCHFSLIYTSKANGAHWADKNKKIWHKSNSSEVHRQR